MFRISQMIVEQFLQNYTTLMLKLVGMKIQYQIQNYGIHHGHVYFGPNVPYVGKLDQIYLEGFRRHFTRDNEKINYR